MNLDQIATKCFILALFIRDDGQRLLLGDGSYDFNQKLQHFQANTIANDIVEIQGDSGQLLAGQVMRSGTQKFEGYIGDATTSRQTIEQKRSDFMAFFRIKHFYKVIYIFPDGTAIQRQRGYLTDAPTIPEIFQKFPEYSVALNFEDANYYEYAEDAGGNEIYAHIAELALAGGATGGLIWDAIGAVTNGITWSGIQTAQGEYISITNELDIPAKLASVEMLGKAEQDGTPTPDSPIPVQVVTGEQTFKIEGKNLIDNTALDYVYSNVASRYNTLTTIDTGIRYATTYSSGAPIVLFKAMDASNMVGKTVRLSANYGQGGNIVLFMSNDDGTSNSVLASSTGSGVAMSHTIIASDLVGHKYLAYGLRIVLSQGSSSVDYTNLIMTVDNADTAYEPYHGQEFEVNLGSIELAKIGNYQDRIYKDSGKWYIEKQVGKVVFDGSSDENWTNQGGGAPYSIDMPDFDRYANEVRAISDNFLGVKYNANWNEYSSLITSNSSSDPVSRFKFRYTAITSLDAWKSWLSTHPTTVYYVLATPTTTEITNEALIAQLDALGASSLYVGLNNIGTETQNAVPTLKIEYYTEVDLDGAGYEWEPGGNTAKTIVTVAGVDSAWPIWTIQGGAQNPTLTNITTGQTITWQGFVPEGQTLTINMAEMTADLAGANVFEFITGEWIRLAPGNNTLAYNAGNADKPSTLSWNGVLA